MAKTNISIDTAAIKNYLQRIVGPINRHSTVIVMVATTGVLIFSVLTVSSIITLQDDVEYRQDQEINRISGSFDKTTIDKINNLNASSDGTAIQLPEGRRNPFTN